MPHRVPEGIIEERAARLRALGETMAENYRRSLIGTEQTVIPEECSEESGEGWSGNYVRVRILRHGLRASRVIWRAVRLARARPSYRGLPGPFPGSPRCKRAFRPFAR